MKNKSIKLKIKVLFSIVFFLAISMCVFSLAKEKTMSNVPAQQEDVEKDTYIKEEKVIETWKEFNDSNLPLISAIPERNIYLYAIKPSGVVLYVDGKGHYFDWNYITPRFILPKMHVGDFDNDDEEELSVILYVGSGSGYAVEELHIVEISEEEVSEYLADHCYATEEYLSQLNELVKLKTYDKEGELNADITVGDDLYTVSLKLLQSSEPDITIKDTVHFGNIVFFNVKDGELVGQFALGVMSRSYAAPMFIGEVYVDVNYNEGKFILSNPRFEADEGFSSTSL